MAREIPLERLSQYESCWKCVLRCFCIAPTSMPGSLLEGDADAQQDAIVSTLARLSAEAAQATPSLSAFRRGLAVLSQRTSQEEAELDVASASFQEAQRVLKLQVTLKGQRMPDSHLLDLAVVCAHFSTISLAAYSKGLYGFIMPLRAFFTRACCLISRYGAFSEMSGIPTESILDAQLVAEAFQPVYWVLRGLDGLIIAVRGTFSMSDVISDVYASQTEYKGHVLHEGILRGARWIYEKVLPLIRREGLPVYVTGHSLGGAIAAVLAWLLREDAGLQARGFVFGVPQVVDESLAQKMQPFVVGIIHGYDMVPQLSHKSLQDFQQQVADAAQTPEERLAKLEGVLQDFALPSSPSQLHRALFLGQAQRPASVEDYEDAIADVGQLPPIVMHNPGWQLHLRRRALNPRWERLPIMWKRSMKHFIIAVSTPRAASKIQPAWTMWQDHWPQSYLYVLQTLADRLAAEQGTGLPPLEEALHRVLRRL